jgi:hypothetical protein
MEKIDNFKSGMLIEKVFNILKDKINEIIEIENLEKLKFDKNNRYDTKTIEKLRLIINEIIEKKYIGEK